jgi:hypothetical protein
MEPTIGRLGKFSDDAVAEFFFTSLRANERAKVSV